MSLALFFASLLLAAGTNASPVPAPPPAVVAAQPALREIAPDIFEFKGILMDKKNHKISFPATVNQREGLIEYLLVNEKGKTHESLFATQVMPHDIHVAMLLIGLKEDAGANPKAVVPPSAIDSAYLESAPKLKGTPVRISVTWTDDAKTTEIPAENWIFNLQTNRAMSPGVWTYNGSLIQDGVFLADSELSIIAVITDPTALVNNTRKGYDNDEIWQVKDDEVPALNTPVEISITFAEPATTKP